jgi:hypothetical protein
MDFYIIDFQENIGNSEYYEKMVYSFNSNLMYYYDEYHNTCNFFVGLFIMSTFAGICICNIINPHPKYIEIKSVDIQSDKYFSKMNNV